jgi:hypothetical protein
MFHLLLLNPFLKLILLLSIILINHLEMMMFLLILFHLLQLFHQLHNVMILLNKISLLLLVKQILPFSFPIHLKNHHLILKVPYQQLPNLLLSLLCVQSFQSTLKVLLETLILRRVNQNSSNTPFLESLM